MSDAAYTLSPRELHRDFEATADRMRGDLRSAGWRELPRTSPERWCSPDRKRTLNLVSAWECARRDATREEEPPVTPRRLELDRSPDFDQRVESDDVHDATLPTSADAEESP